MFTTSSESLGKHVGAFLLFHNSLFHQHIEKLSQNDQNYLDLLKPIGYNGVSWKVKNWSMLMAIDTNIQETLKSNNLSIKNVRRGDSPESSCQLPTAPAHSCLIPLIRK